MHRLGPALLIVTACGSSAIATVQETGRLSAGAHHTCLVQNDGSVWCWGRNQYGELGVAAMNDSPMPVRAAFGDAIAVAGGMQSTCGLKSDHTVWCWGRTVSETFNYMPTQITGVTDVVQLALSEDGMCGLDADGAAWCWTSPTTAVRVATDATRVTSSCALGADGTVTCWGDNSYGELGDGTNSGMGPVQVAGLSDAVEIAGNYDDNCARRADGSVWCWGENTAGQLGVPPSSTVCAFGNDMWPCRPTAAAIPGLNAVGLVAGQDFELALHADGTLAGVGANDVGQLAAPSAPGCNDPFGADCSVTPVTSPSLAHVSIVSAQLSHACAIESDGSVYCWGEESPPGVTQVPGLVYAP